MAACDPHKEASEGKGGDGRDHGVFSYYYHLPALVFAWDKGYKFTLESKHQQLCARLRIPWGQQNTHLVWD